MLFRVSLAKCEAKPVKRRQWSISKAQGARAGGYLSRYAAQPLTALLIAGVLGYGLAYLIHRPVKND
jgi:hypothetical protein